MRHEVLFAISLTLTPLAAVPGRAQSAAYPTWGATVRRLAPLPSDSLPARIRALRPLPSPSPTTQRAVFADSAHDGPECPMPILHPDSSKQFAAIKTGPLRSSDRMPTRVLSCVNPLTGNGHIP